MREAIEELFRMYNVEPTEDLLDALVLYVKHEQLNAKHELTIQTDEPMTMVYPTIVCDDAISREAALEKMADYVASGYADSAEDFEEYSRIICQLPPVTQKSETVTEFADRCRECGAKYGKMLKQKSGKCKNCKYFEYDSVAKVDGIPLIVAHEICNKWGDGCKTSEDGFCFMFEESEDKE